MSSRFSAWSAAWTALSSPFMTCRWVIRGGLRGIGRTRGLVRGQRRSALGQRGTGFGPHRQRMARPRRAAMSLADGIGARVAASSPAVTLRVPASMAWIAVRWRPSALATSAWLSWRKMRLSESTAQTRRVCGAVGDVWLINHGVLQFHRRGRRNRDRDPHLMRDRQRDGCDLAPALVRPLTKQEYLGRGTLGRDDFDVEGIRETDSSPEHLHDRLFGGELGCASFGVGGVGLLLGLGPAPG